MPELTSPEIQPALRWTLLGLLGLAGSLWSRRRFGAAMLLFIVAHCGALLFWTTQLHSPIGLDRSPAVQELWARIAVAHAAGDPGLAYVAGTRADPILATRLAAGGLGVGMMETLFASAPVILVLAFSFAGFCAGGSWAQRCLTAALASTCAPLWGLVVDVPASALARPGSTLIAGFAIVLLTVASRAVSVRWRSVSLALVTVGGLAAGDALSPGAGGSFSSFDWLLLSFTPLAALFLVPPTRSVALALGTRFRRVSLEALLLVSVGAGSSWFWWEPGRTVPGFDEARSRRRAIDAPLDWLRTSAPAGATIASSPTYAAMVSARTGHPVLMPLSPAGSPNQPYRRERLLASLLRGRPDLSLARSFGVTHLFLGPGEPDPAPPGRAEEGRDPNSLGRLQEVFRDENDFRIYLLL